MKRMQKKLEDEINITQAGFRQGRGTRDHIFNMRNIIEKCREYNRDLCACFIDYSKAFDCVQHKKTMANNEEHGFSFPFDIPYSYVISKPTSSC